MSFRPYLAPVLCCLAACGSAAKPAVGAATAATSVKATPTAMKAPRTLVTGSVVSPPIDGNSNMADLQVVLVDPESTPVTLLASIQLSDPGVACSSGTCTFSMPGVDLTRVSGGLSIYTTDARGSGEWAPVSTNTATHQTVVDAIQSGTLANQYAFAIDKTGLAALARVTQTAQPETLVTRGTFVGLAVGSASQASSKSGVPPFVRGVTASLPAGVTITYPNDMFTGDGTATGIAGAFIGVPGSTPLSGTVALTPASTDKSHSWVPEQVTIVSGFVQVRIFQSEVVE